MRRRATYVATCIILAASVAALFSRFHLAPKCKDYTVYHGESLIVIANMGVRTRPPRCLVVNALGEPVADFLIVGEGDSAISYYKTDQLGRTSITTALSVRIGELAIAMPGIRSIVVILKTE